MTPFSQIHPRDVKALVLPYLHMHVRVGLGVCVHVRGKMDSDTNPQTDTDSHIQTDTDSDTQTDIHSDIRQTQIRTLRFIQNQLTESQISVR